MKWPSLTLTLTLACVASPLHSYRLMASYADVASWLFHRSLGGCLQLCICRGAEHMRGVQMGVALEPLCIGFTLWRGLAQTINKNYEPVTDSCLCAHWFAHWQCGPAVPSRAVLRSQGVSVPLALPGRDIYHYWASGLPDKSCQDFTQAAAHQRCCDSSCLKDNTFYTLIRWLFDLGVLHGPDENWNARFGWPIISTPQHE